ncbi:hypothetical protein SAMN04488503_2284 [Humidesulfovibrio mexicanus]|uniref:Putative DnaT-like domain-containing protein n=1 Tax=Humidesulfovibrio mexicanus TaxID=147047 RepID=A0A239AXM7_9BACT|nr:DnaT-like ssDNA-binding protein [Humidesulfovibrio mexicanus]SNS00249.1 hypothetical protein SAMN04488503_2284 [Humidesulfovibrio mexicanus]
MALTIENGVVVPNANTYADLATVTAYHAARGNSGWLASSEDAEPAILRAMNYIESRPWKGQKTAYSNPLCWPRTGVVDREQFDVPADTVPAGVISALCEAALRELVKPGCLAPDLERGGRILSDSIAGVSTSYEQGAPAGTTFASITNALAGLVKGSACVEIGRG